MQRYDHSPNLFFCPNTIIACFIRLDLVDDDGYLEIMKTKLDPDSLGKMKVKSEIGIGIKNLI